MIIFFLIILLIIITFFYYNTNVQKLEKIILKYDNYVNSFNDNDIKLRKCKNKDKCLEIYKNSNKPFTLKKNHNINLFILKIKENLNNNFKKIFNKIKILGSIKNLDSNLPHTIEDYIILPQNIINNLYYSKFFFRLIIHEQFHIFQRYNFNLIGKLYKQYWNFILLKKNLPDFIKNQIRANPDIEGHWLFSLGNNKFILPLTVYNEDSITISDVDIFYVNVTLKNNDYIFENKFIKLSNNDKYVKFFGYDLTNKYHPHEISASIFEDIVFYKLGFINKPSYSAFDEMDKFLKDENLY